MKKLIIMWNGLVSGLSSAQKFSLITVVCTGIMIFIGFAVLVFMIAIRSGTSGDKTEKPAKQTSYTSEDAVYIPKDAVITDFDADVGNIVIKATVNKEEFLYFYNAGDAEPKKTVKIIRK